jgi:hypothetical protein
VAQLVEVLGTNRKVADSTPSRVTEKFLGLSPSGRTMAPGVDSSSNIDENQGYLLRSKEDRCVGLSRNSRSFNLLEP